MSSRLPAPDTQQHYESNFAALQPQEWPDQWRPSEDFPTPQTVGNDAFSQVINDGVQFTPAEHEYRVGDPTLPVASYREFILDTVDNYQRTVLSSATGSGKSSQLGLYLLEAGAPRVFVTQPRILAARELKQRAEFSLGPEYASQVGYLTGSASDSDCGPDAKLIYITEQLLFNMVNRGELLPGDVVIPDEAHERTVGMVALLGLMKEVMVDEPTVKLLVSSATIDTEKFSRYLKDPQTGENAPVLILPGRTFPIKRQFSSDPVGKIAREHMRKGYNVLAFQPGITRLQTTAAQMASRNNEHTVHLLYGDQSPAEQAKALNPEDGNHVVASRIGETSITPQGKDSVVDSGLSNIGLYQQGVRILRTDFSSQATMEQRAGRVGRTKPGLYTVAVPDNVPPPPEFEDRDPYDLPAMEISSVATYLAEMLATGRRLEDLSLIEYPTYENLMHDYKVLRRLGAIEVHDGQHRLTAIGEAMTGLPLDVALARMVVEARSIDKTYDVDSDAVRLQVVAAAAVLQVNGILNARQSSKRRYLVTRRHEENLSGDHSSDVLFSLDVFTRLIAKQKQFAEKDATTAEQRFEQYLRDKDILPNRYYKALRTYEELCRREGLDPTCLVVPSREERRAIIGCQIAGADELFTQKGKTLHLDVRGETRRLGRRSTIDPSLSRLVIGTAFDLQGLSAGGHFNRRFIANGSAVSIEQLMQHAPDRITRIALGYRLSRDGRIVQRQGLYFDGDVMCGEIDTEPLPTLETREVILRTMMTGMAPDSQPGRRSTYHSQTPRAMNAIKQWERAQNLDHKSSADLRTKERYEILIKKIARDSVAKVPLDITDPAELDAIIPPIFIRALVRPSRKRDIPEILQRSPDAISVHVGQDEKMYLPITYRHNIAYITVPREHMYTLVESDFADLAQHHLIKIKVGNNHYQQSEAFFEQQQAYLNSPKRLERKRRREEAAAQKSTPEGYQAAVERAATARKKPAIMPHDVAIPVNPVSQSRKKLRVREKRDTKEVKV